MRSALILSLAVFAGVAFVGCDDAAAEPASPPSSGPARYDIQIDGQGYHPDRVEARAGEPVTLVFHRADERNCGGEVVFASEDIRRDVPVGEPVEVTFTPASAGEVPFTCGMQMYRGVVVVR